jgi:hypothetical protein
MWTTFQRLPIREISFIGKDIDGFVKVDLGFHNFQLYGVS